jgi:hypothetical protein
MGTQFFNMMGADGGAMPKDKYAEGGSKGQQIGNAIDYPSGSLGSMIGGGSTGTPWMKIFEGVHNFKQGMKQATGPAIDEMIANNLGEEYVRQPIAGQPTTSSSNFGNLFGGMDFSKSKRGQTNTAPAGGATGETKQEGEQPVLDQGESFGLKPSAMDVNSSLYGSQNYFNPYTDFSSDPMFADPGRYSDVRIQYKKGGAKPIYGYYQNGGGKKKDESYDGMKDPAQWDIMQNYIASNDTRDRMSQAAVGSGDEMYAPYRVDNTCVAGVNCFEDLAGLMTFIITEH